MADLVKESEIEGMHLLHALMIGFIAGIVIVVVDSYVLTKVETSLGLPAVAA